MRKIIIKTILFFLITCILLINYRFIAVFNGRLMIANTDKKSSWSEIFQVIEDVEMAEYYEPPYEIKRSDQMDYDYYLVLYTHRHVYNVKATEFDIERIQRLLVNEQVVLLEHEPLELW
ncbi:MAG: hypothetical protein IH571_04490, partial [Acholeplasmataceae bacterium]|nr:hypothetical protein [Acholeplasmataceae bacterium]